MMEFQNVKVGDVFANENDLFMKMPHETNANAYNLYKNCYAKFKLCDKVEVKKAKLLVE